MEQEDGALTPVQPCRADEFQMCGWVSDLEVLMNAVSIDVFLNIGKFEVKMNLRKSLKLKFTLL